MAEQSGLGYSPGFRSGFVAMVGRPNVGKSTLVNLLVGSKVSITSEKPQTTRHRIAGVLNGPGFQMVLLDMPGFQRPLDQLTRRMQDVVDAALTEVDIVLFLLNGEERVGRGDTFIAAAVKRSATPVIVAINKADVLTTAQLVAQAEAVRALGDLPEPFLSISARTGSGVDVLRERLTALLPEGPAYFPKDVVTDQREEMLIAELIREKAIRLTEEEVPHSIAVQVLEMEPREDSDIVYVQAAIYVERDSQKPILVGEGGKRIKLIGSEARQEIQALLGSRIYLDLSVRVRKHWRQDPGMLGRLGL
jgi:GTP-binding protein Era